MIKLKQCALIIIAAFSAFLSVNVQATQVAVWKHKPIQVELPVGKERIILFSDNVKIGLPQSMQSKVKVSNIAGTVYITALTKFPMSRVQIIFTTSGKRALLDLYSRNVDADFVAEDLKILTAEEAEINLDDQVGDVKKAAKISAKDLIQFAAQDWFAPTRLKPHNALIRQSDLSKKDINLDLLFLGSSAGLFDLRALKEYSTGRYYLTAIGLKNRTVWPQVIKYDDVDPYVTAVSSQHTTLGARGTATDTTILYVITESPLAITTVAYYE